MGMWVADDCGGLGLRDRGRNLRRMQSLCLVLSLTPGAKCSDMIMMESDRHTGVIYLTLRLRSEKGVS